MTGLASGRTPMSLIWYPAFRDWRHSHRNGLTASQHGDGDVAVGTPDSDRDIEVLPRRDSVPRHTDDAVASHQAGFLCRRARHHGPDQRRLIDRSERARPECPGRMPSRRQRAECSSPDRRRGSESAATWFWRGTRQGDRIEDPRGFRRRYVAAKRHSAVLGVAALTFRILSPKPSENVRTRTPCRRAARKCPNSWTKIRTPSTKRKANSVIKTKTSDRQF